MAALAGARRGSTAVEPPANADAAQLGTSGERNSLEQEEIAELQGMIEANNAGTRRTTPMSVGKYRQWTLI